MRYRIEARAVVPMSEPGTVFAPGQVTWDNDRIVSVGPVDETSALVDQVIQAPEGIVMPGLYNGHNHAAMTLLRGLADDSPFFEWLKRHIWPAEARLTADDIYAGTLLAAAEMIRTGTVGFADMYFEVDAVARAVVDSGLRGWISRGLIGDQDPGGEKLAEAVEFGRRWTNGGEGRVTPMLGPHAPYTCTPDYLARVAEAAAASGLGIHIHLAESEDEVRDLQARYGRSPIQIAAEAGLLAHRTIIAHGVHIADQDLPYLQGMAGGVISCPVSNAKLGNGILPYARLAEASVPMGLGTDGPASTNTLDMFQEMKAMAWLQKVRHGEPHRFTARDALWLATRGSAAVLGFDGGRLYPGGPADLIVVDTFQPHLSPELDLYANLVYAAVGKDVSYTIVNGRILMADGIITAFDEAAVIKEARERSASLLGRRRG